MSDKPELVDLGTERCALGQMIAHGAYPLYIGAGLEAQHFWKAEHRMVFEAIAAVEERGVGADIQTVALELTQRKWMDEVLPAYYGRLSDGVPKPDARAALAFTAQLEELAQARQIRTIAARLGQELTEAREPIAAGVVDRYLAQLESALRRKDKAGVVTADQQLPALRADIARDDAGRLLLGFPNLDCALDGLRPGEVCGLMARPGVGKTLVICHVACVTAETEHGHVIFSLEMPAPQIIERLARMHFVLGRYELRDAIKAETLDAASYRKRFERTVIVDTPGLSVGQMQAKLRQIQLGPLKGVPIRLVTIDHLGLIGGDRKMTTYDRVSTQSRELKELAKTIDATVLLAVQVNRDAGGDGSKELGLGAARDSGVVEEAMDYLVALRRLDRALNLTPYERDKYRDAIFAKVVKNRHGDPGLEVGVRFSPRSLCLMEDTSLTPDENDLGKIASMAGRGRR